jgi:hypothetical protein
LWGDVPALMPITLGRDAKVPGVDWHNFGKPGYQHPSFRDGAFKSSDCSAQRRAGSGTSARKAASAMIAKIPEALSRHIARTFKS